MEPKLKFTQILAYSQLSKKLESFLHVIPQSGKVYRLLHPKENPDHGIFAKDIKSELPAVFHVVWGSSEQAEGSKYISTCLNLNDVEKLAKGNICLNGDIVSINVDKAPVTEIIHVWDANVRTHLLEENNIELDFGPEFISKFHNFANSYNEVLLVGNIPKDCVTLEKRKQDIPNKHDRLAK